MAATLEKISDDELAPGDVRKRWRLFKRLAALFNALLNFQIVFNTGRNFFSITDGNATLELDIPAPAVPTTANLRPFALADVSDDSGYKVSVRPGALNGVLPAVFAGGAIPLVLDVNVGDQIYAGVTGNTASGGVVIPTLTRTIASASSVPVDDPDSATFYYGIGSYDVDRDGNGPFATNIAYGAIDLNIYRILFTPTPTFGVVRSSGG